MGNMFSAYFSVGWEHIISWSAADHVLFVMAMVAMYGWRQWRAILMLVTAFTLGHSVTLVLSTFNLVSLPSRWVEFAIPLTICITSLYNAFQTKLPPKTLGFAYALAACFGAVHGLGFANALKSLLGKTDSIFLPLLGFNLGVEAGQLVVVAVLLCIGAAFVNGAKANQRHWMLFLSGGAFFSAAIMVADRWPF
ncbi:MAG: HupE/UreJ family protein [Bacteroidetes bacterium]|nr:MAG: HupE/UreJ family protein [Bacteroidota bacterium]